MEGARPRLEVLDGGGGEARSAAPVPPARRRWPTWLLGALLLLALLGVVLESRRAVRLETRVAGLETELEAAEQALGAHRRHLDEVRRSVFELQELVSREPAPGSGPAAP